MDASVHTIEFTFEGSDGFSIECREDEDVVTAALRQGYILLTECREGTCSTCKGFLAEGDYDELLNHSVHALSPSEEEEGWVLACRLQPRSDLLIEYDYPFERVERFAEGVRNGQIVALERLSDTVARVVVRTLAAQEPVRYEPGQYVKLTLRSTGVARDYSMADLWSEGRELEFLIRVLPDGAFSGYIANEAQVGELIDVEGPLGLFVLRQSGRVPVFVAGGTGLAPILAMLRSLAVEHPDEPALLFFGNTNPGDLFFQQELKELVARFPALSVHQSMMNPGSGWDGEVGVVTDALRAHLSAPKTHDFYVCGPPPMIQATRDLLTGWGVDPEHIHEEKFLPTGSGEVNEP